MKKWLTVIGVGEEGEETLSPKAKRALAQAENLIGSERLLRFFSHTTAKQHHWTQPFSDIKKLVQSLHDQPTVILATGDPLNYGVARKLLEFVPLDEMTILPHLSAFSLAAARQGWSLPDCDTLTLHGRAAAHLEPFIQPEVKLLVLTADASTIPEVCRRLNMRGFGVSTVTVMENIGGDQEKITSFQANEVPLQSFSNLNTLAIHCHAEATAKLYSTIPGLPDDSFHHDGQLTKREVRTITLTALQPAPEQVLWDIGAGCGSIAIEWMRAQRGSKAIAFEQNHDRCKMIAENAENFGVPTLKIIPGLFPEILKTTTLPLPDAIFIGGGITETNIFASAWDRLKQSGRLVVNVITLEGEAILFDLQQRYGGELTRIDISNLVTIGTYRALKPRQPVTQWRVIKQKVSA